MNISFKNLVRNRIRKSLSRRKNRFRKTELLTSMVERLEDRTLLAGNVMAAFQGGNLVLRGDDASNSIGFALVNNQIVLSGLEGTTINGINEFLASGSPALHDNLRISTHGGNDTILIGPGMHFDDVTIRTGKGNDTVNISGSVIHGNLNINTGRGDDGVRLSGVTVGDNQRIRTGRGDDTILIEQGIVGDKMRIRTSSGDDVVSITETAVDHFSTFRTGSGHDSLVIDNSSLGDPLRARTRPGDDFLSIDPSSQGNSGSVRGFGDASIDPIVIDDRFNHPDTGINPRLNLLTNNIGALINPVAGDDDFLFTGTDTFSVDAANGLLENDMATFPGDQLSVSLAQGPANGTVELNSDGSFTYTPNSTFSGIETFTYLLSGSMGGADLGDVSITVEELVLEVDLSGNDLIQSNGISITNNATFNISGTTVPGATVEFAKDHDGLFDDGVVIADEMGLFSMNITLSQDDGNHLHHGNHDHDNIPGSNHLHVRSTSPITQREQIEHINVHFAEGTVVRFNSSLGSIDVELLDQDHPNTVANFFSYLDRLSDTIIHRSVSNFIVQGGGFEFDSTATPTINGVVTDPPITNEFKAENSNIRGTLSMAQLGGDINSGTSQWFFNIVDNLFLDNVPHTVFGVVIGSGMDIVDAINAADTFNLTGVFPESALTDVPLVNFTPFTEAITGTVSLSTANSTLRGFGTSFESELQSGASIMIDGQEFTVGVVLSDTEALLNRTPNSAATTVEAFLHAAPLEANYVLFSDISKLLEQTP